MDKNHTVKITAVATVIVAVSAAASFFYFTAADAGEKEVFSSEAATTTASITAEDVATSSPEEINEPVQQQNLHAPKQAPEKKEESFKLNAPYFHQQYKNSCEASSLRMALGYYGIQADDMAIVNTFGYAPRLKDVEKNIWDDPQKMFVGFVDLASSTGGYGTYGQPVARAAQVYGRTAEYKTSITPQELAAEIKAGHPVIMWGYTSLTQNPYTWNLADSSGAITGTVKAFHGEHARLVVGILGPVENPSGFYVHDPMVGAYQYWSRDSLMRQFNSVPGVTNQAVIVK